MALAFLGPYCFDHRRVLATATADRRCDAPYQWLVVVAVVDLVSGSRSRTRFIRLACCCHLVDPPMTSQWSAPPSGSARETSGEYDVAHAMDTGQQRHMYSKLLHSSPGRRA